MRNASGQFAHGSKHLVTHGMSYSPIYRIWRAMLNRCENPNVVAYRDYGGRGIIVCERWRTFENFYADMGERPEGRSLDRIDNDGPYSPANCRWASRSEQSRNRRDRRKITVLGETKTIAEWAETSGLRLGTIWARLDKGWSELAAVTTPKLRESRR